VVAATLRGVTANDTVRHALRAPQDLDLTAIDARGRPVGPRDKDSAAAAMTELEGRLDPLQEALYAEAAGGGRRAVLLVLQGMDTSGKGGVIEHAAGAMNPQGLQIASFKKPTTEELAHDFLWRIHRRVPAKGEIGIFNRSHYEDVLVVRVHGLAPRRVWSKRYEQINDFERTLAEGGTTIVKFFLAIDRDEQRTRIQSRYDDPKKRWKEYPRSWPASCSRTSRKVIRNRRSRDSSSVASRIRKSPRCSARPATPSVSQCTR